MVPLEVARKVTRTAGMEWNRDQRWRYSIEANLGVPFYTVGDSYYPASFAISFGIAH